MHELASNSRTLFEASACTNIYELKLEFIKILIF